MIKWRVIAVLLKLLLLEETRDINPIYFVLKIKLRKHTWSLVFLSLGQSFVLQLWVIILDILSLQLIITFELLSSHQYCSRKKINQLSPCYHWSLEKEILIPEMVETDSTLHSYFSSVYLWNQFHKLMTLLTGPINFQESECRNLHRS